MNKKKKVAIFMSNIHERATGLGEFQYMLGSCLAEIGRTTPDMEFTFVLHPSMTGVFGDAPVRYIGMERKEQRRLKRRASRKEVAEWFGDFDLVHFTTQTPEMVYGIPCPAVMTIHDLNFMHDPSRSLGYRLDKWLRTRRYTRHMDYLSFISNYTREDVIRNFKPRCPSRVIMNGVRDLTGHPRRRPGVRLPDKFLLHMSRLAPNKNVGLLVRMMRHLPDKHLVLAGGFNSGRHVDKLQETCRVLGLDNVHFIGEVTQEEKCWLMANTEAMLFPSKCEGFGLPVAEQMRFGLPVFCSCLTSLPEVGGGAAYYFTELNPKQMAAAVRDGLADFERHRPERERAILEQSHRFEWSTQAAKYMEMYRDILRANDNKEGK